MPKQSSQIRIISGTYGGRLIDTPKTELTHPMGDRERSAIFNRLRGEIEGKTVLDAFAGSGALGLEALSLGAESVDFLENNPVAIKTIEKNIAKLKLDKNARVVKRRTSQEYKIIFADPPYDKPQYALVEQLIDNLAPGGYFVLSHPASPEPPEFIGLALISDKKYAAAHIKIYQKI